MSILKETGKAHLRSLNKEEKKMKVWKRAELQELSVDMTQNGGTPSLNFDQEWFDENGAIHVNFTPENQPMMFGARLMVES